MLAVPASAMLASRRPEVLLARWHCLSVSKRSRRSVRPLRPSASGGARIGASTESPTVASPSMPSAASIPTEAGPGTSATSRRAWRFVPPAQPATSSDRTKTDRTGIRSLGVDRRKPTGFDSKVAASRPVSRVLYRNLRCGDDHPSAAAGYPTAQAADPRTGQRDLFRPNARLPARSNRVLLFGLAPSRVCRVSPPGPSRARVGLRLCGTGPRLAADGRYPLPCAEELGLSSRPWPEDQTPRSSSRLAEAGL